MAKIKMGAFASNVGIIILFICCLVRTFVPTAVFANDYDAEINWKSQITQAQQALGFDLVGDSIDYHTGSISFNHVDVSLPGNSNLEVAIRRKNIQGNRFREIDGYGFGDWILEVPHVSLITLSTSSWTSDRCTNHKLESNVSLDEAAYSNGLQLHIPGEADQLLGNLIDRVSSTWPAAAKYGTSKFWYVTCLASIGSANEGEQGFIAHSPDGRKYTFNKPVVMKLESVSSVDKDRWHRLQIMLATQVEDQYGNWVKYDYNDSGRPVKIYANDGRQIDIVYVPNSHRISEVRANGRVWNTLT